MKEYKVQLKSTDTFFIIKAFSCYTKDGLLCFKYLDEKGEARVKKFPLCGIHSVDSPY